MLFVASASRLIVDAGFNKMVPLKHPYMQVYRDYEKVFGGANRVAIALVQKDGDIFNKEYMAKLKGLTDDVFLLNGVDRPSVKSLFTPNTRFIEVIEEGFAGGNVIPATFQGTDEDLKKVRANVQKSSEIGRTVATDFTGALVTRGAARDRPADGQAPELLRGVRPSSRSCAPSTRATSTRVHIIGFAKAIGDIRDGARGVITFFGVAFVITAALMLWFVKDLKLTLVALVVAMMPVLWLLGTLPILGFGIDPLSILVPFLIFSIGVSHAVQMTKTWEREVVAGADSLTAAKRSFAKLFIPGTLALLTNVLGFAVIMLIPIDIVRELGITASLGVAWMIVTNKMLLPILLSHLHDLASVGRHQGGLPGKPRGARLARGLAAASSAAARRVIVAVSAVILARRHRGRAQPQGGRLRHRRAGAAPRLALQPDNAKIVEKFAIGVNTLGVVAQTKDVQGACTNYDIMTRDRALRLVHAERRRARSR